MKKRIKTIESNTFLAQAQLDFHEFGVIDMFDIEKYLTEFLEDSYINKYKNVLVITGKGNIVRPAVLKLLVDLQKKEKFVKSFKTAGYFNGQSGAFEVSLND